MSLTHRVARMTGRNPDETHRAATPLELLFDLTFVVAFSQATAQTAHVLELGHVSTALIAFPFVIFGITWAWINYSWLASAYDTDDLVFRLATFVEMIGVLVFALGIPAVFDSVEHGEHLDNTLLVIGYIIMRVATIALWLRVARDDPARRATALTYVRGVAITQSAWIVLLIVDPGFVAFAAFATGLMILELLVPALAERRGNTPWHASHIAERYGLLVIITLGEVILGTILAVSAVVRVDGWTLDSVLLAIGGTLLAFAMWWTYFALPSADMLRRHRNRAFGWGYGHILLFGCIVIVGAGLHVAATVISGEAHVDEVFAITCVAIGVVGFEVMVLALYAALTLRPDRFHMLLAAGCVLVAALGIAVTASGAGLGWGILVVALSPTVIVVGYETIGHTHVAKALSESG